jgi:Holliday junction resolvase RusA-like endonuclease
MCKTKNKDRKRSKKFSKIEAKLNIKPLSVNEAYLGRKRKSGKYRKYTEEVLQLLPNDKKIPNRGALQITYTFGVSSRASDVDNPIKPFTDLLQKKYGFNDNRIYHIEVDKVLVNKGDEFVSFVITKYNKETDFREKKNGR